MLKGLGIHDFCIVYLCCAKVDKEAERPILGTFGKGERVKASHMFLFSFAIENPGFVQALLKKRNQGR